MAYVLSNLSGDKLEELRTAVYDETKRRFLATATQYPKLENASVGGTVKGTRAYSEAYCISLSHAHTLFNYYHR